MMMKNAVHPIAVWLATVCLISLAAGPALAADSLATARPGQIVQLPDQPLKDIPLIDAPIKPVGGPTLLFSDGPEYFPADGIGLREDVPAGRFRLYIYHCPVSTGAKKTISSVIENLSDKPMTLRFLRYGFQKPGRDYLKIGKAGLLDYFNHRNGPADRTVPPHGRIVLDPAMDQTVVTKDDLVHAFHEIEVDQPARVFVFQRDPGRESLKVLDTLPLLERGPHGAGRGKFTTTDFKVAVDYDTSEGARQIVVADGKRDPWIAGHDAIAGHDEKDKGNYGVIYHIRITRHSTDGRAMALLIVKPQADKGRMCSASAAVVKLAIGKKRQVIPLPTNEVRFHQYPEAVVIQTFPPLEKGRSETIELTYSPPGASCLPTPFLLVPIPN